MRIVAIKKILEEADATGDAYHIQVRFKNGGHAGERPVISFCEREAMLILGPALAEASWTKLFVDVESIQSVEVV